MAAIDDLKKSVGDISAAIIAAVAKFNNPSSTDADVEAAAQELETLAQNLNNAINPTPVTAASPSTPPTA